ncbi:MULTISPECIES: hypothetical protein [Sporosarcina]|uniref:hypothetical protein n=1 Tax=Sporosarcina TaxID=1569 RepID=UPI00129B8E8C|nr:MULTISPECIES: hypothetical protein [Sporosarcina]GKV66246.1 hypothetical protein NCCP2331_23990 [Sporosarcina sp. NCCP-2331]GLB56283.1 hypothetical protein NCCP2378_20700 [Sporosarcina sp. NCCP-2378]
MMKSRNIIVAVLMTAFIALNSYLVFSEKSVIPKSFYVNGYERLAADDYTKELDKEGFIAPKDLHTVYLKEDQTIDSWLVNEGETVDFGTELASLKTDHIDQQRSQLNAERAALQNQVSTIRQTISDLEYEQKSSNGSRGNSDSYDSNDDKKVQVNIDVGVDVVGEGTFAQAIADAERDLAQVQRQIETLDSKIDELPTEAAMTSPVNGYVVKINRDSASVDIYSTDQTIVTYVLHNEWQDIEPGSFVTIQHEAIRTPFVSKEVPEETPVSGTEDEVAAVSADGTPPAVVEDQFGDDLNHDVDRSKTGGNDADLQDFDTDIGDPDTDVNSDDNPDGTLGNPDGSIDNSTDEFEDPNTTIEEPDSTIEPDNEVIDPNDTENELPPEGGIIEMPEGQSVPTKEEKKLADIKERITPDYPTEISTLSGTVVSVSKVPAQDDKWLKAYKALGNTQKDNPLAYYEVRIAPYDEQLELPFGTNVNTFIQTNEANQATSIKTSWLVNKHNDTAKVWTLDSKGRAVQTVVETPFTSLDRSILVSGTQPGAVALYNVNLDDRLDNQSVFHPQPLYLPEWDKWKGVHWQSYVRYMVKH